MDEILEKAAAHWDTHRAVPRTRWWMQPEIFRHINRIVCGEEIPGAWAGLERRMRALSGNDGFRKGISIGCGNGAKEISLVANGIVAGFDLFEISGERIKDGRKNAEKACVSDRIRFHHANVFEQHLPADYDLVYWNNSLHHMLDTAASIRWSHDRLRTGGYFVMDDFVGPSRFQWTDYQLEIMNRVRAILPDRFFVHPADPKKTLSRTIRRPGIDEMIAADPTEAADSANILPALRDIFPEVEVIPTGGVLYHTALNNVLANFLDETDAPLLAGILLLDETLARNGDTQYAQAFARR